MYRTTPGMEADSGPFDRVTIRGDELGDQNSPTRRSPGAVLNRTPGVELGHQGLARPVEEAHPRTLPGACWCRLQMACCGDFVFTSKPCRENMSSWGAPHRRGIGRKPLPKMCPNSRPRSKRGATAMGYRRGLSVSAGRGSSRLALRPFSASGSSSGWETPWRCLATLCWHCCSSV